MVCERKFSLAKTCSTITGSVIANLCSPQLQKETSRRVATENPSEKKLSRAIKCPKEVKTPEAEANDVAPKRQYKKREIKSLAK